MKSEFFSSWLQFEALSATYEEIKPFPPTPVKELGKEALLNTDHSFKYFCEHLDKPWPKNVKNLQEFSQSGLLVFGYLLFLSSISKNPFKMRESLHRKCR